MNIFCRDQQPSSIWLCDLPPNHHGVHSNAAMQLQWDNKRTNAVVGCRSTYGPHSCGMEAHRGSHLSQDGEWRWSEDGTSLLAAPKLTVTSRKPVEFTMPVEGNWMVMGDEDRANRESQQDQAVAAPRSRTERKRRKH